MFLDIHTHHPGHPHSVLGVLYRDPVPERGGFSYGIHPMRIDGKEDFSFPEQICQHPRCVAVGECGLDKRSPQSTSIQRKVFEKHILWAEKLRKPLIIHCVGLYDELLRIKKASLSSVPWILHGFSKSPQMAEELIRHDFYLSMGAAVFSHPDTLKRIPDQKLFLETDQSDLSIEKIYLQASQVRKTELEKLEKAIEENFQRIFKNFFAI